MSEGLDTYKNSFAVGSSSASSTTSRSSTASRTTTTPCPGPASGFAEASSSFSRGANQLFCGRRLEDVIADIISENAAGWLIDLPAEVAFRTPVGIGLSTCLFGVSMILLFGFGRYLRTQNGPAFQLLCAACTCLIQAAVLLNPRQWRQQSQEQEHQQQGLDLEAITSVPVRPEDSTVLNIEQPLDLNAYAQFLQEAVPDQLWRGEPRPSAHYDWSRVQPRAPTPSEGDETAYFDMHGNLSSTPVINEDEEPSSEDSSEVESGNESQSVPVEETVRVSDSVVEATVNANSVSGAERANSSPATTGLSPATVTTSSSPATATTSSSPATASSPVTVVGSSGTGMFGSLLSVLTSPFRSKEAQQTPLPQDISNSTGQQGATSVLPASASSSLEEDVRGEGAVPKHSRSSKKQQQQQRPQSYFYGLESPLSSTQSRKPRSVFASSGLERTPSASVVQPRVSRGSTNPFLDVGSVSAGEISSATTGTATANGTLARPNNTLPASSRPKRIGTQASAESGHYRGLAGLNTKK